MSQRWHKQTCSPHGQKILPPRLCPPATLRTAWQPLGTSWHPLGPHAVRPPIVTRGPLVGKSGGAGPAGSAERSICARRMAPPSVCVCPRLGFSEPVTGASDLAARFLLSIFSQVLSSPIL